MFVTLLMMLQATAAAAPAPERMPQDVVVTGRPLSELKRQLDACLARKCPPKEDIDTSLAYAEAQFVAGDYQSSRKTLLAARHRNARFAAELPVDVSDLHRANARLAGLNGLSDAERIGEFDMIDALKAGLDGNDARVLLARLEVADIFARQGRFQLALDRYDLVKRQARDASLTGVAGIAQFRKAVLLSALASVAAEYKPAARRAVKEIERTTDPAYAPFRNGVQLLALKLLPKDEQAQAVTAAFAKMEPVQSTRPLLAYSPPIETQDIVVGPSGGSGRTPWADVGFDVAADGTVQNVHVLRTSDQLEDKWLAVALRSLNGRRYMPVATPGALPANFSRVERYSFVTDLVTEKGTRLLTRATQARVSVIDMTIDAPAHAKS